MLAEFAYLVVLWSVARGRPAAGDGGPGPVRRTPVASVPLVVGVVAAMVVSLTVAR